jgi:bacillithiol biosynthesis cysteine-adding enzyme BshC
MPVTDLPSPPAAPDLPVRVRSVPLGGTALSRTMQDPEGAASWGMPRPGAPEAWRARVATVRADFAGGAWLDVLRPAFAATGVAAARLARAAEHGVVVTTGQQPGLFGGPAYTISKALTALALADALEAELRVPVAPVFWAATDDADWAEAAEVHVATRDGVCRLAMAGPATEGIPMAEVPLGPLDDAWAALEAACGSGAHATVLATLREAYHPTATVGGAYLEWLRALLAPLGIAVLDASHVVVREAADPLLRRALARAVPLHEALEARSAALEAAGLSPQVELVAGRSLVFRSAPNAEGRRQRERVPLAAAAQAHEAAPLGALGPNVVLRPVVERALLPTVAYVAGPGELAYGAQVAPVATVLEMAVPLFVPRWAGEVVDRRVLDAAAALGIEEGTLESPHGAEALVAQAKLDDAVADALERLRLTVETQVALLGRAVQDAALPVPLSVVERLGDDLARRLSRHERRLLAAVKRQEVEALRQVAMVRGALRPYGRPPERTLSLVPLLVRYGRPLLEQMGAAARGHAHALVRGAATPA